MVWWIDREVWVVVDVGYYRVYAIREVEYV